MTHRVGEPVPAGETKYDLADLLRQLDETLGS